MLVVLKALGSGKIQVEYQIRYSSIDIDRNEVWRFERKYWGTPADRTFFLFGYAKYGAVMFAAIWLYFEVYKGGTPPHHHHHYYEDYTKTHGVHGDKYALLNESKLMAHGANVAHH